MVNSEQLLEHGYPNRGEEIKDAISHYERAAEKGHLDAITDLGHIYENGIRHNEVRNGESNIEIKKFKQHQQSNQFLIKPSLDHALKYYALAKKEDFPRAINNLGAMHIRMHKAIPETMKGTNIEKGIKYLKKAAELKYPKAYLNLGQCYESGIGFKENLERAKLAYVEGAELGDISCRVEYARCVLEKEGSIDDKTANRVV